MDYEELLKRAKANLPAVQGTSRFEMPKAVVVTTKRQIFIKNFTEIAKALRREPKHLAKYLFKEFAMPGNISGSELVLQGKTSTSMINSRIEDYAKECVLCSECGKPDTNLIKEGKIDMLKCEACGARRSIRKF